MSDLSSKLSTLIEKVQINDKNSYPEFDVANTKQEPSAISNLPIESDRDNLIKYLDELEERNEDLVDENRILSSALGEYFTQKKVTRGFHELSDKEYEEFTKNYHSQMEYLCKIKMKRNILQEEFEEKYSMIYKELEAAKAEFSDTKNGKISFLKLFKIKFKNLFNRFAGNNSKHSN